MKAPQLFCSVLAVALAAGGCHRQVSQADVKQTASDAAAKIKVESAEARDQLADVWLSTKIHSKFVGDRDINAREVAVSTKGGVGTRKGRVLSEPMRQLAVAIAKDTDGVKQVVNQLDVQIAGPVAPVRAENSGTRGAVATTGTASSTTAAPDDARVTSSIQSKYFLSERLKGRHVNGIGNGGIVTLNGDVGDENERAEALLLARTTDGVARVEDSLTVTAPKAEAAPAASPATAPTADTDDAVSARVKSQLSSDAQVKGAAIDVTAKNGVVLLQGTVPSRTSRQRALTVTRGIDGVTQVVDRLKVGKASK